MHQCQGEPPDSLSLRSGVRSGVRAWVLIPLHGDAQPHHRRLCPGTLLPPGGHSMLAAEVQGSSGEMQIQTLSLRSGFYPLQSCLRGWEGREVTGSQIWGPAHTCSCFVFILLGRSSETFREVELSAWSVGSVGLMFDCTPQQ